MADYIFCLRKKSNPRIDVRICQKKCEYKEGCAGFLDLQKKISERASIIDPVLFISPILNPVPLKH